MCVCVCVCGRQNKIRLLNFLACVPPTDCLLKPLHRHFDLVCPYWCQTCWICSNWLGEYPITLHHALQVNTPNAAGLPPQHPTFRQTVNQPFNRAKLSESPKQQVCQLDTFIRSICLIYLFLMRSQLQTGPLISVSIHQIQIRSWRFCPFPLVWEQWCLQMSEVWPCATIENFSFNKENNWIIE